MAAQHRALPVTRRRFVQGAGVASVALLVGCGRLPWQAPPPAKVYRLGYLTSTTSALDAPRFASLEQGLRDLGWTVGQNLTVERRYAEGQVERIPGLAAELVRLQPAVIVSIGNPTNLALKQATSTIPIVFATDPDPVGSGLVVSFAHPGGNLTGVSQMSPELAGKRLELLKQAVPTAARVGTIFNVGQPGMVRENGETLVAAQALGVDVQSLGVRTPEELDNAFQAAVEGRLDGIVVIFDPLIAQSRDRLVALSTHTGVPTISGDALFAAAGGLMSYGPNFDRQAQRAAYYVDRILRGTSPADLPVEQPTTFDFVINLQTAQALDLTIPQYVLLQATEVIQ